MTNQSHANDQHGDAPPKVGRVVEHLIGTGSNVMQVQQLMVDQAFDGVEQTPAHQHATDERPCPAFLVAGTVRRHQSEDTGDRHDPRRHVEDPVTERVELQIREGIGGRPSADHVVPLQDLMQDDAVE
jgi:hypothetical protein